MKTRPYIILAPSYCVSAGVRVLHTLCHELNALGFDAKLLISQMLPASQGQLFNPSLNTPCINGQLDNWDAINDDAIVICSDGIPGRPLNAKRIVRYILGKEGASQANDEFKVYYSKSFPTGKTGTPSTLFFLPVDLGLFNDKGASERTQDMLWLGKGAQFCTERPADAIDVTYTWPPTRQELAANFRRTRYLYSYDAVSCTNLEAILCGAVVILKHLSYHSAEWTRRDMEATEAGIGGFAFGDSDAEIARALATRHELVERCRQHYAAFRPRLLEFVDATQNRFRD